MKEAIEALKAGDRAGAYTLLRTYLAANPRDANGWLWMSEAAVNPVQQVDALKRVLALAPDHPRAAAIRRRLSTLEGDAPPPPPPPPPVAARPPVPVEPEQTTPPPVRSEREEAREALDEDFSGQDVMDLEALLADGLESEPVEVDIAEVTREADALFGPYHQTEEGEETLLADLEAILGAEPEGTPPAPASDSPDWLVAAAMDGASRAAADPVPPVTEPGEAETGPRPAPIPREPTQSQAIPLWIWAVMGVALLLVLAFLMLILQMSV